MGRATILDSVRWWLAGVLFRLAGRVDEKYDVWLDAAPRRARPDRFADPFKHGLWHRRTVELLQLLSDATKVQRSPCHHTGIGKPGCVICDPRVRDAIGVGHQVAPTSVGGGSE